MRPCWIWVTITPHTRVVRSSHLAGWFGESCLSWSHMATHVNELESFSNNYRVAAKNVWKIGQSSKTKSQNLIHSLFTFCFIYSVEYLWPWRTPWRKLLPHRLRTHVFDVRGVIREHAVRCRASITLPVSRWILPSLPKVACTSRERAPLGLCIPLETLRTDIVEYLIFYFAGNY